MKRTFATGLAIGLVVAVGIAAAAITYERYDTKTLKRTLRRDAVLCGVNTGLPGFSTPDDKGNWAGFDVDFCRAVAAAIFNDPNKVRFVPLDATDRFKELQSRKVDILSRNSTWSLSRETNYELYFPAVSYYDGQGFMVPKARKLDAALDLDGSKVCVQDGTTTVLNLADYFRSNNIKYAELKFARLDDAVKAYNAGQCDTFTADASQLYALRLTLGRPDDHVILPDVISK
ncbi:amino acid ABC transporter substrate-binding protein, partial [Tardiphaga sp.]|uniref:amino acid ABC transporter substrate-binding protein n=1 Tax=Tardiphaga sp. TaxID=1926292 RepID=UPI0025DB7AE3